MAPIKFEDHLREKLQERELQPGKEAWGKLSEALGEEPRDQSRKYWLYGIAASLLLAIFVGRSLWDGGEQLQEPSLVEETNAPQPEADGSIVLLEEEEQPESVDPAPQKTELAVEEAPVKKAEPTKKEVATTKETTLAYNEPELIESEPVATNAEPEKVEHNSFTDAKVAEVVDAVLAIQDKNHEVTPEEIDALLAKANRELANQRLLEQATGKIDPMSLLNDVEMELERSFRDKVFDALGKGFNEVRTAVVQRNN